MAIVPRIRLRCELAAAASYSVVSLMTSIIADRLAGVVLDLPEIERGGTAAERRVAAQRRAVEHALEFLRRRDHAVAEGRGQLLESLPSNECTARSMPKRFLARSTNSLPKAAPTSAFAMLLPSRMIGVMPKMLSASRPGSTPTIGLPVLFASTTVLRRAEMSSPNTFGAWTAVDHVAGGSGR